MYQGKQQLPLGAGWSEPKTFCGGMDIFLNNAVAS